MRKQSLTKIAEECYYLSIMLKEYCSRRKNLYIEECATMKPVITQLCDKTDTMLYKLKYEKK